MAQPTKAYAHDDEPGGHGRDRGHRATSAGSAGSARSARGRLGLLSLHAWHRALHGLEPLMGRLLHPDRLPLLRRVPAVPAQRVPRLAAPHRPWDPPPTEIPDDLRTQPGIERSPDAEDQAARDRPLHLFFALHADAVAAVAGHMWPTLLTQGPRVIRSLQRLRGAEAEASAEASVEAPAEAETPAGAEAEAPGEAAATEHATEHPRAAEAPADDPTLTAALREQAAQLGISTVGVAAYDPRYTLAEYTADHATGHRVIVCLLEQNYEATQRIPAERSEQAAFATYAQLQDRMVGLVRWLHDHGYSAHPESYIGESIFIHYAVDAGLGQLGLNGQLLTPQAGSRCRINLIHTDAPLALDAPVDYGIEGVCDRCQACVRRCPVGAIPAQRKEFRGITKAKLNTKRCLPIVTQAAGCSVCMKVCPVQAYGLDAVLDEYRSSGEILGTHTDALEGYDWPLDGRHYGPGEKPKVPEEIVRPPGYELDPDRVSPPAGARPVVG